MSDVSEALHHSVIIYSGGHEIMKGLHKVRLDMDLSQEVAFLFHLHVSKSTYINGCVHDRIIWNKYKEHTHTHAHTHTHTHTHRTVHISPRYCITGTPLNQISHKETHRKRQRTANFGRVVNWKNVDPEYVTFSEEQWCTKAMTMRLSASPRRNWVPPNLWNATFIFHCLNVHVIVAYRTLIYS